MSDCRPDWTQDVNGRVNNSPTYVALVAAVERLILDSAQSLIRGHSDDVARLIVSQLAHVHQLQPPCPHCEATCAAEI